MITSLRLLRCLAVLLVSALLVSACAEEDTVSPPPPAACGTKDAPASCTCGSSYDCFVGHCCLPGADRNRCVAYEGLPVAGCLP